MMTFSLQITEPYEVMNAVMDEIARRENVLSTKIEALNRAERPPRTRVKELVAELGGLRSLREFLGCVIIEVNQD